MDHGCGGWNIVLVEVEHMVGECKNGVEEREKIHHFVEGKVLHY